MLVSVNVGLPKNVAWKDKTVSRRPDRSRRRPGAYPHRAVRGTALGQPRPDRPDPAAAAPAARATGCRTAGHLRPQRHHHRALRQRRAQCDRPRRRLRRPRSLELPDRRLPHLHHPLLSGHISYTPTPLELPADGQVLICCAQPRTDVVLDMQPADAMTTRPQPRPDSSVANPRRTQPEPATHMGSFPERQGRR